MPGIFPQGGVGCEQAFNTVCDPLLEDGCTAKWHAPRCVPKFDPASQNAFIAEFLNLMKCNELPYDCKVLTNLCAATRIHQISGRKTFKFDDTNTPITVPNGTNRNLGAGSFIVPNTFHRTINVFMEFEATIQFQQTGNADNTSSLDIDIQVDTASDFSGSTLFLFAERVRSFETGKIQFAANPTSARGGVAIPPGGREFYWRARSTQTGPGGWEIQYTDDAVSVTIYGISAHTRDVF